MFFKNSDVLLNFNFFFTIVSKGIDNILLFNSIYVSFVEFSHDKDCNHCSRGGPFLFSDFVDSE